jgi:hypothetical protein
MPPMPQAAIQEELLLPDHQSPDVRFAARQLAAIQRELAQRSRTVLRTVSRWLQIYEYVQMLEEESFQQVDRHADQDQIYRGFVGMAKSLGGMLLARLQSDDVAQLEALGLTYADLAASVKEMADLDRALNTEFTPEMSRVMAETLFGGAEPGR